jgi:hypothetical protein
MAAATVAPTQHPQDRTPVAHIGGLRAVTRPFGKVHPQPSGPGRSTHARYEYSARPPPSPRWLTRRFESAGRGVATRLSQVPTGAVTRLFFACLGAFCELSPLRGDVDRGARKVGMARWPKLAAQPDVEFEANPCRAPANRVYRVSVSAFSHASRVSASRSSCSASLRRMRSARFAPSVGCSATRRYSSAFRRSSRTRSMPTVLSPVQEPDQLAAPRYSAARDASARTAFPRRVCIVSCLMMRRLTFFSKSAAGADLCQLLHV